MLVATDWSGFVGSFGLAQCLVYRYNNLTQPRLSDTASVVSILLTP